MNVSLTPELHAFVGKKVASGMYQTASEVVREGLRLLREQDQGREQKRRELRRAIAVGLDQANRGELRPFNERTIQRVKARGRRNKKASR